MFGSGTPWEPERNETEVEKLRRELQEAQDEIKRLREMLGSNHPHGVRHGLFG